MNAEKVANDKIMWYVLLHLTFVVIDDGVATAGLITTGAHRSQGHRVGRRHGDLLLQEHPEDALLLGGQDGKCHGDNLMGPAVQLSQCAALRRLGFGR